MMPCDRVEEDLDSVLQVVRCNGQLLRYVSPKFRAHRDVVIEAVRQNGLALYYASEELMQDWDIVLEATRNNQLVLCCTFVPYHEFFEDSLLQAAGDNPFAAPNSSGVVCTVFSVNYSSKDAVWMYQASVGFDGHCICGDIPWSATLGELGNDLRRKAKVHDFVHMLLPYSQSPVKPKMVNCLLSVAMDFF